MGEEEKRWTGEDGKGRQKADQKRGWCEYFGSITVRPGAKS